MFRGQRPKGHPVRRRPTCPESRFSSSSWRGGVDKYLFEEVSSLRYPALPQGASKSCTLGLRRWRPLRSVSHWDLTYLVPGFFEMPTTQELTISFQVPPEETYHFFLTLTDAFCVWILWTLVCWQNVSTWRATVLPFTNKQTNQWSELNPSDWDPTDPPHVLL